MASHLTPEEAADYYQTKQPAIVATSVLFLVMSNVSVFVRILSQLRLSKRLFVDDFAIIFAVVWLRITGRHCQKLTFIKLCSDVTGALYLNGRSSFPKKFSNAVQLTYLATTNGLGLHIYRVLIEDPSPPQHAIALFKVSSPKTTSSYI